MTGASGIPQYRNSVAAAVCNNEDFVCHLHPHHLWRRPGNCSCRQVKLRCKGTCSYRTGTLVFLKTETVLLLEFATTKSGLPSPSMSPMATLMDSSRREVNLGCKRAWRNGSRNACIPENRNSIASCCSLRSDQVCHPHPHRRWQHLWIGSRREVNLGCKRTCRNGTGNACVPKDRNSIVARICNSEVWFAISIHITESNE